MVEKEWPTTAGSAGSSVDRSPRTRRTSRAPVPLAGSTTPDGPRRLQTRIAGIAVVVGAVFAPALSNYDAIMGTIARRGALLQRRGRIAERTRFEPGDVGHRADIALLNTSSRCGTGR